MNEFSTAKYVLHALVGNKDTPIVGAQEKHRCKAIRDASYATVPTYIARGPAHPQGPSQISGDPFESSRVQLKMAQFSVGERVRWDVSNFVAPDGTTVPRAELFGTIEAKNGRSFHVKTDYVRSGYNAVDEVLEVPLSDIRKHGS